MGETKVSPNKAPYLSSNGWLWYPSAGQSNARNLISLHAMSATCPPVASALFSPKSLLFV